MPDEESLDIKNQERIAEIKSEFLEDVITDFNENNHDFFDSLSPEEREWIVERIKADINKITAAHISG